jgi:hypothetical protein
MPMYGHMVPSWPFNAAQQLPGFSQGMEEAFRQMQSAAQLGGTQIPFIGGNLQGWAPAMAAAMTNHYPTQQMPAIVAESLRAAPTETRAAAYGAVRNN